jgi:hypothetical protein
MELLQNIYLVLGLDLLLFLFLPVLVAVFLPRERRKRSCRDFSAYSSRTKVGEISPRRSSSERVASPVYASTLQLGRPTRTLSVVFQPSGVGGYFSPAS